MQTLTLSISEVTAWVGSFMWPLFRVAALFSVMPVLGATQVPARVRMALAAFITFAVMPIVGDIPAVDPLSSAGIFLVFAQVLIGILMGFMLLLVFNAIVMGAESIAISMGLGFALMTDPQNGVQIPVVGQFYQIMATLLFLALNGHHAVLQMMADSFVYLPISAGFHTELIWQLLSWSKVMFVGALKIALPAIIAMLTVNMIMGIMTRAAPQFNVFSVGFPATMTIGFLVLALTLPVFLPNFEKLLIETYSVMGQIVRGEP
ncbi:MAG TPA: flagellar biosynthetic protein FliR [Gammaproteobacteria bacterium]|jgi:flagellar biosynthetic protein FliR|nr:flagellar biosynthetic protein FliR [Gammaproteobacteria bacterium]